MWRPGGKRCHERFRRRWSVAERGIRSGVVAVSPPALDENLSLVVGQCPLLALSGHFAHPAICPLLGVKRTCLTRAPMSAFDPKRTFTRVAMRAFTTRCGYEGDHEAGVNVPFGRPETDGVQLISLPLKSARLEGGCYISIWRAKSGGIAFCHARN